MIPLYGDYADGFWDKSTQEGIGSYYKAFNFKGQRVATSIGTDFLTYSKDSTSNIQHSASATYPYFTCELGGGMATAYHRRPYVYPEDAYSMALVKLGSGSNLLGYYMYHGGTNPEGRLHTLNECQTSPFTANNDLPVCTYDFQAPLGEFGQTYPQYYRLRPLHLFMQDFGELLAPMEASFPVQQDLWQGDDTQLRWSFRSDGKSAFVFINNYERFANLIPGVPTTIVLQNGRTLNNVKPQGLSRPVSGNIYLLSRDEAENLFLPERASLPATDIPFVRILKAATPRVIQKGKAKVAAAPTEEDWQQAAVYRIKLPVAAADSSLSTLHSSLLSITYRGDCARLFANGRLVADNFYYGRPFLYGLWRLPTGCTELELRILPLQPDAPIYLPREADCTPGEALSSISLIPCK